MPEKRPAQTLSTITKSLAGITGNQPVIGRNIILLHETDSTSSEVWKRAKEEEGLVICAEKQTSGRGRHGRQWHCPSGKGLLFSVLLKPALGANRLALITSMAAVAACRTIKEFLGLQARIKGPNDIIINGRKAGGILTETRLSGGEIIEDDAPSLSRTEEKPDTQITAVLGIGLNVNVDLDELPDELSKTATSIKHESDGKEIEMEDLFAQLLAALDNWYRLLKQGKYGEIEREWSSLIVRSRENYLGSRL